MSYEIIKSIVIKDSKVIFRASSNNVSPRYYDPEEYPYFTKIYQDKGVAALELEIFKQYETGSFQTYPGIANKYTRALIVLRAMPEYAQYDWRNNDYEATEVRRKSPEFEVLLRNALDTKQQRGSFVIHHPVAKQFLRKHKRGSAVWRGHRDYATVFSTYLDADQYRRKFSDWPAWEIIDVKKLQEAA